MVSGTSVHFRSIRLPIRVATVVGWGPGSVNKFCNYPDLQEKWGGVNRAS
jgi:hypothetical protein